MEKRQVNPWAWQEKFGFSHAWRVDGARSVVFLAGQGRVSAEGKVVGEGDFVARRQGPHLRTLRTVLEQAGASFDAVVKLTVFMTDIAKLRDYARVRDEFITGAPPASTALEVSSLALPGMMIEVEAIAVL